MNNMLVLMQCSKLLPVRQPEADNFGGGPGTFLKLFFNFMFMIWDSRPQDWQLFWLSFEHCFNDKMFWWLMKKKIFDWVLVEWAVNVLSAEMFISTGEWGVQMPTLTEENSQFLQSGPQEVSLVMFCNCFNFGTHKHPGMIYLSNHSIAKLTLNMRRNFWQPKHRQLHVRLPPSWKWIRHGTLTLVKSGWAKMFGEYLSHTVIFDS